MAKQNARMPTHHDTSEGMPYFPRSPGGSDSPTQTNAAASTADRTAPRIPQCQLTRQCRRRASLQVKLET